MDPLEREAARQRGQRKLETMQRRTSQLRRRVVATAIVGFVLLWTVVFVQMATGNDPVLGTGTASRQAAVEASATPDPERRNLSAATAPPSEEKEVEQAEIEREEAEARELEELEAVTTGQS